MSIWLIIISLQSVCRPRGIYNTSSTAVLAAAYFVVLLFLAINQAQTSIFTLSVLIGQITMGWVSLAGLILPLNSYFSLENQSFAIDIVQRNYYMRFQDSDNCGFLLDARFPLSVMVTHLATSCGHVVFADIWSWKQL